MTMTAHRVLRLAGAWENSTCWRHTVTCTYSGSGSGPTVYHDSGVFICYAECEPPDVVSTASGAGEYLQDLLNNLTGNNWTCALKGDGSQAMADTPEFTITQTSATTWEIACGAVPSGTDAVDCRSFELDINGEAVCGSVENLGTVNFALDASLTTDTTVLVAPPWSGAGDPSNLINIALRAANEAVEPGTAVTVGTSSTVILPVNALRVYARITNISDETIYMKFGETAVLSEGVPLAAGDMFELDQTRMINTAINGICTSGDKDVAVVSW